MTPSQAADLLTLAAAFDQRTIGTADALAWGAALEHIGYDDARQAVIEHYQRNRERIWPADVVTGVRRIRTKRLADAGDPPPATDPDNVTAYRTALIEGRTAIAAGDLKQRPVAALTVGQAMPRPDYGAAPRRAREHLQRAARERAHRPAETDAEPREKP